MLLDALTASDLYLIAGFTVITTVLLVIGNILADLLTAVVDPRVKAA
jgi:peptide/nickel transport system permease protein